MRYLSGVLFFFIVYFIDPIISSIPQQIERTQDAKKIFDDHLYLHTDTKVTINIFSNSNRFLYFMFAIRKFFF